MQDINYLRKKGKRITAARKAILESVAESQNPISAIELMIMLSKKSFSVNKTTVYRELEFLKNERLIREIDFLDGKRRYEATVEGHHHHVVCKKCGDVEELGKQSENFVNSFSTKSQFLIQDHRLEFFGLCPTCKEEK